MAHEQNITHIPSIDPRLDKLEACVECLTEDVQTIKIGMGYKDKYNGEFKAEVESESQTMSNRLLALEQATSKMESSLVSMKWILALILPVFAMLLVEILLKL